jgi:hypothetical protein
MTIATYRYGRYRLPRVLWILEEILAAPFLSVEKEMEVPAAD